MDKNLPSPPPPPPPLPPPPPPDTHEQSRLHLVGEVVQAESDLRRCETGKMKDGRAEFEKTKRKLHEAEQKIRTLEIELQKERSDLGQCQKKQCTSIRLKLREKNEELERLKEQKRAGEENFERESISPTLDKIAEMERKLENISQKMDQVSELKKKLEEQQQQRLTYEKESISHGVEIGRLHSLLQAEKHQAALLQRHTAEMSQYMEKEKELNSKRCPRQASECNKVHKKMEKRDIGKAEKQKMEELERQVKSLQEQNAKLIERMKQVKSLQDTNAKLCERIQQLQHIVESPECQKPRCVQLEQKNGEQQKAIEMVSPMKNMAWQYDGEHDQLKREFEELMTNPDGILGQLEKEFDDPFDARIVLAEVFMAAYEECKKYMIESFVTENLKQLFTVQTEPDEEMEGSSEVNMDGLSHAFGLLLHSTAAKSHLTCSTVIPSICKKVKQKTLDLESCRKANEKKLKLPVKQAVELAWKFVAVPNPMIVCQPETFSPDIHGRDFQHWKKLEKPYQLIYARPVVYRSYHGVLVCKGLVGNEAESSLVDP